ncbi:type IV toxin-antitoxin system AbiEi family antitoxin domain-containing protein [Mycolicibacterium madagascariense]|uniref:type IV toxin-antitoxin system AbiEi family antitoxin domain-containing protein n=1 Tax=Mycolicibacterium madagascariense TaxID=212765 RepID=UPI0021F35166|nr:type IV toxin-antitoxin system AbiEi family antitoxin domain-containing protein [Mycolicibacterium madagascariense]MCV7013114.1 type IV toxin-antitoxin system AbiEi family antitoxin domain-containing protein [Mycolicibacterium madagascariense]
MLDDHVRHHDGVITLAQALRVGLSEKAVRRRVQSGHWRRCSRGVYFVDDRPFTDAARIRAAVWGHGDRAAASGLAAAYWHSLTTFAPHVVEVTMPRNSHGRSRAGCRVRRRDLVRTDVVERRGLRVTALPLTVIEAAVRRGGGPALVDAALRRHTELQPLWAAHVRNKGRYGSPAARRLLHAAEGGAKSEAERLFKRLLTKAGITGWTANQRVAGYEVDFVFRAERLAVEIDGFAFHSASDDFQHDRIKQNAIALAGFQVLRFTWLDLTEYPERVLAEVRRAISAR